MNQKHMSRIFGSSAAAFAFGALSLVAAGCRNPAGLIPENRIWQLDLVFGTGGTVSEDVNSAGSDNYLNDMAVDSNGKIVVTGSGNFGGGGYIMYAGRFNADGSLDTGFATDGFFIESVASIGRAVEIDSDGRIVVSGYRTNGSNNDAAVWRFTPGGAPDSSFDGDGCATSDIGGANEDVFGLGIDSSGRIVISGLSHNGTDNDMTLWRFLSNGSLDTTFGTIGYTVHDNAAGGTGRDDRGKQLAIDPSGRIVVTGSSNNGLNDNLVVWRYTTAGILDTSFSGDGWAVYDSGNHDEGYGVAVYSSGKVVATGCRIVAGHGRDMLALRFNSSGGLDASFGENGIVLYDYAGQNDFGYSAVIGPANQVLVAGIVTDASSNMDIGFWAYDNNGSPQTGFGTDGVIRVDYEETGDEALTMTMDSEGGLLIGGDFETSDDRDIFMRRYVFN